MCVGVGGGGLLSWASEDGTGEGGGSWERGPEVGPQRHPHSEKSESGDQVQAAGGVWPEDGDPGGMWLPRQLEDPGGMGSGLEPEGSRGLWAVSKGQVSSIHPARSLHVGPQEPPGGVGQACVVRTPGTPGGTGGDGAVLLDVWLFLPAPPLSAAGGSPCAQRPRAHAGSGGRFTGGHGGFHGGRQVLSGRHGVGTRQSGLWPWPWSVLGCVSAGVSSTEQCRSGASLGRAGRGQHPGASRSGGWEQIGGHTDPQPPSRETSYPSGPGHPAPLFLQSL